VHRLQPFIFFDRKHYDNGSPVLGHCHGFYPSEVDQPSEAVLRVFGTQNLHAMVHPFLAILAINATVARFCSTEGLVGAWYFAGSGSEASVKSAAFIKPLNS